MTRIWRWWIERRAASDPLIDQLIVPPVQKYAGVDEALVLKTKRRRDAAEAIRRRADAVASGSSVTKVISMARR